MIEKLNKSSMLQETVVRMKNQCQEISENNPMIYNLFVKHKDKFYFYWIGYTKLDKKDKDMLK